MNTIESKRDWLKTCVSIRNFSYRDITRTLPGKKMYRTYLCNLYHFQREIDETIHELINMKDAPTT